MCGCMIMHAMAGHEEHEHTSTPAPVQMNTPVSAAGSRKCAHCGFPLQAGFTFCPGCGMRLGESKCPACGQRTDASWKTCAYCGSPLTQALPA